MRKTRTTNNQDVESRRQLRSRIVQILNGDPAASPLGGAHRRGAPYSSHRAPLRVRLRSSLAVALPDNDFEHPGERKAVSKEVEEYLARYS